MAKQSKAPSGKKKQHYKVKKGDSFWTIARHYRVPVRRLAKWNSMASRDTLQIGQKLVVWVDDTKSRNSSTKTTLSQLSLTKPGDPQVLRKLNYKVRNGDSLSRIASKFNLTIAQIAQWNSLNTKRYLQPGQRLKLFVDVRNL